MAKAIMIQGTCSNAGKSLIAAGLCRIFRQDGLRVAPFKAQNMALNSCITADGLEMGRAQAVQAQACGLEPDVRMNPLLLKPTSDCGSQVIVNGEVAGNLTAAEFYRRKPQFAAAVQKAYASLAAQYDVIVIEGAGSPAEINLKQDDIVNMGMAKMADAPVLLVGDIDRGGVFAALAGTMLLLDDDERVRVKGTIINKFRGDVSILEPGLRMLEARIGVPTLGVVPYLALDIDDEDSLSTRLGAKRGAAPLDVAVVRLPRISNFSDFSALDSLDAVSVRYVGAPDDWGAPDLVILPGSKNTMEDLLWLRQSGLEAKLVRYAGEGGPVFGICGGYQMLGKTIEDPAGMEHGGSMAGIGLLGHTTVFRPEKTRSRTRGRLAQVGGVFARLSGLPYEGYEIHMGVSGGGANLVNEGSVYGTYLHGIFDSAPVAAAVAEALLHRKGLDAGAVRAVDRRAAQDAELDKLAAALRAALDMDAIDRIAGLERSAF